MQSTLERFQAMLDRTDARIVAAGRVWPVALFLFAFALKAAYVLSTAHSLEIRVPIMDAKYYDDMARAIVSEGLLRPGAFFMGPLYPYFLALVYSIFGRDFLIVRLIQALGGATTVVFTFLLGKWVFRPSVGLVGAVLLGLYGAATFYEGQILMMWLGTLLNMGALLALVSAARTGSTRRFAVAGLLVGLSALARANVLVLVPVAIVWIAAVLGGEQRWRRAAVFVIATFVAILPATIHNYIASRDLVVVTSNAGLNFYIGNSLRGTGIFYPPPGTDFVDDTTTRIHIERELGRDLRPSEVSRYWFGKSLREIAGDPGHEVRLVLRKAALFFNGYEIPQLESYEVARRNSRVLRYLFVSFWFLVAFGVVGMIFSVARWRDYSLLSGFVLAYALSIVAFFVTGRYRVQIAPVLALFAAWLVVVAIPRWIATPRRAAILAGSVFIALLLTSPSLFAWDENEMLFRDEVHRGRRLAEEGHYRTAISTLDRAIARFPDYAEGYVHRAIVRKRSGDRLAAIDDYAHAIELRPDVASIHYDLAQTMRELNLREDAIAEYRAALALDPVMIQAQNNLGITLRELGRYDEAVAAFRRVIELDPSYARGYNNLGASLAEAGRVEEALAVFEEATQRFPEYPNSYRNLAMANITLKRVAPAIAAMERFLLLVPGDRQAREVLQKLYVAARADTTAPSR